MKIRSFSNLPTVDVFFSLPWFYQYPHSTSRRIIFGFLFLCLLPSDIYYLVISHWLIAKTFVSRCHYHYHAKYQYQYQASQFNSMGLNRLGLGELISNSEMGWDGCFHVTTAIRSFNSVLTLSFDQRSVDFIHVYWYLLRRLIDFDPLPWSFLFLCNCLFLRLTFVLDHRFLIFSRRWTDRMSSRCLRFWKWFCAPDDVGFPQGEHVQ